MAGVLHMFDQVVYADTIDTVIVPNPYGTPGAVTQDTMIIVGEVVRDNSGFVIVPFVLLLVCLMIWIVARIPHPKGALYELDR